MVRRSAVICIFSADDEEMTAAKIGNWWYDQPQRSRSNNSAMIVRGKTTQETFDRFFKFTKEYGEPGFIFADDERIIYNPCCEIAMAPFDPETGESGWQFCNLTTMSGNKIKTKEDFFEACFASAVIGTVQATYNKFPFLGKTTENIFNKEALLGCSITGIMKNPSVLLDPETLRAGAEIIKEVNIKVAAALGINPAARLTCVKPEGSSSAMTGNSSGCHGDHAKRYLRRVQINTEEDCGKIYSTINPHAVDQSIWSTNKTDNVISFAIEAGDETILKKDLFGIKQLEAVKLLQENWVMPGCTPELGILPTLQHNVSNTIGMRDEDWTEVQEYIWENRNVFSGISLLSSSGDLAYNQAPFVEVLDKQELIEKYGDAAIFASGLIVDTKNAFNDLWIACDAVVGKGEKLYVVNSDIQGFKERQGIALPNDYEERPYNEVIQNIKDMTENLKKTYVLLGYKEIVGTTLANAGIIPDTEEIKEYLNNTIISNIHNLKAKRDIVRRIKKFSFKFFNGDIQTTLACLKHVDLYHKWMELTTETTKVDWENQLFTDGEVSADTLAGAACSAGGCEVL